MPKRQIQVSLQPETIAALDAEAQRTGRSRSYVAAQRIERAKSAEVDDLVAALRDMVEIAECDGDWHDPKGEPDSWAALRVARAALAPFETEAKGASGE